MTSDSKRTIKLYCPSVSKVVKWGPCDFEERIDLGSIAAAFGVEAQSLRLNGHLISRGADLIASSVTWNSLLSFFSSRGLPTGLASDPLLLHAKLSRLGSKRVHVPENSDIEAMNTVGCGFNCIDRQLQPADGEVVNAKRLKDNKSGEDNQINSSTKRRSLYEHQNSLKRTRLNGTKSEEDNQINSSLKRRALPPQDQNSWKRTRTSGTNSVFFKRNAYLSSNNNDAKGSLSCSFIGLNLKRAREDEMLLASPCKRLR